MKTLIIFSVIILTMVYTNPTKEDFSDWLQQEVISRTSSNTLDKMVAAFSNPIIKNITLQKNYVLFSIFEIEDRKVLGAFKQMIPLDYVGDIIRDYASPTSTKKPSSYYNKN